MSHQVCWMICTVLESLDICLICSEFKFLLFYPVLVLIMSAIPIFERNGIDINIRNKSIILEIIRNNSEMIEQWISYLLNTTLFISCIATFQLGNIYVIKENFDSYSTSFTLLKIKFTRIMSSNISIKVPVVGNRIKTLVLN